MLFNFDTSFTSESIKRVSNHVMEQLHFNLDERPFILTRTDFFVKSPNVVKETRQNRLKTNEVAFEHISKYTELV